jgi:hypothetical protein
MSHHWQARPLNPKNFPRVRGIPRNENAEKIRNAAPLINASSKFPVSSMLGQIARAERQFSALLLALSIGIPRYSSQENAAHGCNLLQPPVV